MSARISMTMFFFLASLLPALTIGGNALADEAIPFIERSHLKYIPVQVNGVSLELVFDTGANSVVLNSDALKSMGITQDRLRTY